MSDVAQIFNPTLSTLATTGNGIALCRMTTAARNALSAGLGTRDRGQQVYDSDLLAQFWWNGTIWVAGGGSSSTGFLTVVDYGADPTGVADSTVAFNTAAASGMIILIPKGTYKLTNTINLSANTWFLGAGIDSAILNLVHSSPASTLADNSGWDGVTFTSPYSGGLALYDSTIYALTARRITSNTGAVGPFLRNVKHELAGSGFFGNSPVGLIIENYQCNNLREWNGLARTVVIVSGTNCSVTHLNFTSCDGGCDIRNNSTDCWIRQAYGTSIFPNGFVGQPGGYATNTLVFGFSTSNTALAVLNCGYDTITATGCYGNEIKANSNAAAGDPDTIINCWFRNVTITNSLSTGTNRPGEFDMDGGGIDGLTINGTTSACVYVLYFTLFCHNVTLRNLNLQSVGTSAIFIQGGCQALTVTKSTFLPPSTLGTGIYINDDGTQTTVIDNDFDFTTIPVSMTAGSVCYHTSTGQNGCSLQNRVICPTGGTNKPSFWFRGASFGHRLNLNTFRNGTNCGSLCMLTGTASGSEIIGNVAADAHGSVVNMFRCDVNTTGNIVTQNQTNNSLFKCLDEGTSTTLPNQFFNNTCGGIVDRRANVLGVLKSANFNVTTDQVFYLNSARCRIRNITVTNASVNLTTAAGGFYTAAAKGGTAIVAAGQTYVALTAATKFVDCTLAAFTADVYTAGQIFFSLTTGQGAAATADIWIIGDDYNSAALA